MQKNNILVSIVMNCYNSDEYLKESIESILNQTYKNFEIIFWDNKSTDNSAKIINSYNDKRIKYYMTPKFTLLGEARNLAVEKCSGEWIGFLDCDDIYDKNKILYSLDGLDESKLENVSLIYTKTKVIDSRGYQVSKMDKVFSGDIHNLLLTKGNFIALSSIMFQKHIFYKVNQIDVSLNYCEDLDLLLKISKVSNILGIDKYLTSYRTHIDNITSSKYKENTIELNNYLSLYILNHKMTLLDTIKVKWGLLFGINIVTLKLVQESKYNEIFSFINKYKLYSLFLPITITEYIIKKLMVRYNNRNKHDKN